MVLIRCSCTFISCAIREGEYCCQSLACSFNIDWACQNISLPANKFVFPPKHLSSRQHDTPLTHVYTTDDLHMLQERKSELVMREVCCLSVYLSVSHPGGVPVLLTGWLTTFFFPSSFYHLSTSQSHMVHSYEYAIQTDVHSLHALVLTRTHANTQCLPHTHTNAHMARSIGYQISYRWGVWGARRGNSEEGVVRAWNKQWRYILVAVHICVHSGAALKESLHIYCISFFPDISMQHTRTTAFIICIDVKIECIDTAYFLSCYFDTTFKNDCINYLYGSKNRIHIYIIFFSLLLL